MFLKKTIMKNNLQDYRNEMAGMQARSDFFNKGVPVEADKRDSQRSGYPVVWTKVQKIVFCLIIFAVFMFFLKIL
jgi:hypothetical protein